MPKTLSISEIAKHNATILDLDRENVYTPGETTGVMIIVSASAISALAVLVCVGVIFSTARHRFKQHHYAHLMPILLSLLVADLLQSIGSVMSARWAIEGEVKVGSYCSAQGGLKQAGNVGIAVWNLACALLAFRVLFQRGQGSQALLYGGIAAGWIAIIVIVCTGPALIHNRDSGPFFGVSGLWCWITDEYPHSQTYLEYFIEWTSATMCFVLYTVTLLRVRGNLVRSDDRWHLRFLPDREAWRLAVERDVLDAALHKVAGGLIWFPVTYTLILLPISIARFVAWSGHAVAFWGTVAADVLFNLNGLAGALLLLRLRGALPETAVLPALTTRRARAAADVLRADFGIEPFTLLEAPSGGLARHGSRASAGSAGSGAPLLSEAEKETSALPVQTPFVGSEKMV